VLVTGGSGGIGRAVCLAFAREQWSVGIHYCTKVQEATRTLARTKQTQSRAELYRADVRLAHEVKEMIDLFVSRHGGLDVLVCNAGVSFSSLVIRHNINEWTRVIDTNLTGVFYCLQAAGEHMARAGGGAIIVVGSHAAVQGRIGQAAYAAAKAGLLGLVRTAGREWGRDNIRVNLIYPGWQNTSLAGEYFPIGATADHLLGRTADVEEVARTVYHVAHLEGVSGQVWSLDSRPL